MKKVIVTSDASGERLEPPYVEMLFRDIRRKHYHNADSIHLGMREVPNILHIYELLSDDGVNRIKVYTISDTTDIVYISDDSVTKVITPDDMSPDELDKFKVLIDIAEHKANNGEEYV